MVAPAQYPVEFVAKALSKPKARHIRKMLLSIAPLSFIVCFILAFPYLKKKNKLQVFLKILMKPEFLYKTGKV
jgi:hypothetical protein